MKLSADDAHAIFVAQKSLQGPFRWIQVDEKSTQNARLNFECRVAIGSAIRRGVFFRMIVFSGPGFRAVFQLEVDSPNGRTHTPLYRLEVNPLAPHSNALYGAEEINGISIPAGQTHEHIFYDSLTATGELRARADEQARPVSEVLEDFRAALSYVCSKVSLINGNELPEPPSQGILL